MSQKQDKAKEVKKDSPSSETTERREAVRAGSLDQLAAANLEKVESTKSGPIQVSSGHKNEVFDDLVGHKVGEVRATLSGPWNIAREAQAFIDGQPVSDETVIQEGATLEFIRQAGVKG